jgi:hypothetical protein
MQNKPNRLKIGRDAPRWPKIGYNESATISDLDDLLNIDSPNGYKNFVEEFFFRIFTFHI